MSNRGESPALSISSRREWVIEQLCLHVAADTITLEEFERRVDQVHRTDSISNLDSLLSDLPTIGGEGPGESGQTTRPGARMAPRQQTLRDVPIERRESQVIAAVMGGATRKGPWVPAERSTLIAMMGGIELDFREAALGPGLTELTAIAVMGGIEIIVPPDIFVEADGIGIMGGFDHQSGAPNLGSEGPRLRIRGLALMGGVEIRMRHPGETAGDARRRERAERRAARREQREIARSDRRIGGM